MKRGGSDEWPPGNSGTDRAPLSSIRQRDGEPFDHYAPLWHTAFQDFAGIGNAALFRAVRFFIHYNYSEEIATNGFARIYNFGIARFARLYPLFAVGLAFDLVRDWGYGNCLRPPAKLYAASDGDLLVQLQSLSS